DDAVVIDDQDFGGAGFGHGAAFHELSAGRTGREMVKREPAPTEVSTSNLPPWSSTIREGIANPSPGPSPGGLVGNEGAKRWVRCAGSIPDPVSDTRKKQRSPSCPVSTVSVPSSPGSAWRPFCSRFKTTWPSCPGSPQTGGRPEARLTSIVTRGEALICAR